jgi:hypothetical protein
VRHRLFFAGHRIFRAVAAGVVLVAAAAASLPVMASPLAGSGPRVALAASVMNLLSIPAAYGVLTAVTQDGRDRQLSGFPRRRRA